MNQKNLNLDTNQNNQFSIQIRGYSTWFVSGHMSQKAYQYWINQDDIDDLLNADEVEDIPGFANIFDGEHWSDCEHEHSIQGYVISDDTIVRIFDQLGNQIMSTPLTVSCLNQAGIQCSVSNVFDAGTSLSINECVYLIEEGGYGEIFTGKFTDPAEFTPKKLTLDIAVINGKQFVDNVYYNGIAINIDLVECAIGEETSINIYKG